MLLIALAQFNPIVGDIAGNTQKIIALAHQAIANGASVLVTPELALTGYPPEDLLLRPHFYHECQQAMNALYALDGLTLVIGHPTKFGNQCFNTASVIKNGHLLGQYHKMTLPNYAVFDECRYFTPGAAPFTFVEQDTTIGVLICEDVWSVEPAAATAESGANVIVVLNASPFHRNKVEARHEQLRYRAEETGLPYAYVNLVGAQDELVFDGASFAVNRSGEIVAHACAYDEALLLLPFDGTDFTPTHQAPLPDTLASIYQALVLGLRDYVNKNGFPGVVLGLSGGIDSALTLVLAADALGADRVRAVMMPSVFTASISLTDARDIAHRLGITYDEISIWPLYTNVIQSLAPYFSGLPEDSTEENIQARLRGLLLMAVSNKTGHLVISTGNKSELATGYCTMYGDMAGGYAILKDVAKTLVYQLAHWRNQQDHVIPERILTRPPSAELRADQQDQDSLPPYHILDAIMHYYVEENSGADAIIAQGYAPEEVDKVIQLLLKSEYKRRQAPIGPRITQRSFGKDWRYPITNRFS